MQAVILAAGMGKRLKELTSDSAKCMVKVNEVTLIKRMLLQLDELDLSAIIIVVGYKAEKLMNYILALHIKTKIVFVENSVYDKTNNIYSLYLAKDYLLQEDTLLMESDLIFESQVLREILENPYPSLALVDKFESWMDGTVVELDADDTIHKFLSRKDFKFENIQKYYKTVNIYKFSKGFSNTHYVPFLEAYSKALGRNEYYEQVLKVITLLEKPEIKALPIKDGLWYEIDDIQDLNIAESIFAKTEEKLLKMQHRYGGYWRYPHLSDFCYLVNPFFPNQKLLDEMKANFECLVCSYPSGIHINNLLAAKYYGVATSQICVGNGAAELIKSLMEKVEGKVGIIYPTFEEYAERLDEKRIEPFYAKAPSFAYTAVDLMQWYEKREIQALVVINPDNPSGNYLNFDELTELGEWCEKKSITLIVDDSFSDFADKKEREWLCKEMLLRFPTMVVVKSISKSFGVPGLRLGVLASADVSLMEWIKKDVSIWNINSLAEYFLQIFEKYRESYEEALIRFHQVRKSYIEALGEIKQLQVFPSQSNYVMCRILDGCTATRLTEMLLNRYDILIKDLSVKKGFEGREYIRIAIKDEKSNERLILSLKSILR